MIITIIFAITTYIIFVACVIGALGVEGTSHFFQGATTTIVFIGLVIVVWKEIKRSFSDMRREL